jgi:hypothetical protein
MHDGWRYYSCPRGFGAGAPDGTSAFGELGFTLALVPSRVAPGRVSGAVMPEPVVPDLVPAAPPSLLRGWLGAPVCSAPDFIEPGFTLPGGGVCATAAVAANRLAAASVAMVRIMSSPCISSSVSRLSGPADLREAQQAHHANAWRDMPFRFS